MHSGHISVGLAIADEETHRVQCFLDIIVILDEWIDGPAYLIDPQVPQEVVVVSIARDYTTAPEGLPITSQDC